jgi:predicted O-methyltransferase YrrM
VHLVTAASQTSEVELMALEQFARGCHVAFEFGSFQGVSAARIAGAMAADGLLYCVDPWPRSAARENPCYSIFRRHLQRSGYWAKVRIVREFSNQAGEFIPADADFAFVDGDHSWAGVESDWQIVRSKLKVGGIVCLHDSVIPKSEPWRQPESVEYYRNVISTDSDFETIEHVHSLAALRRVRWTYEVAVQ